jgi:hypothetical protein
MDRVEVIKLPAQSPSASTNGSSAVPAHHHSPLLPSLNIPNFSSFSSAAGSTADDAPLNLSMKANPPVSQSTPLPATSDRICK